MVYDIQKRAVYLVFDFKIASTTPGIIPEDLDNVTKAELKKLWNSLRGFKGHITSH